MLMYLCCNQVVLSQDNLISDFIIKLIIKMSWERTLSSSDKSDMEK